MNHFLVAECSSPRPELRMREVPHPMLQLPKSYDCVGGFSEDVAKSPPTCLVNSRRLEELSMYNGTRLSRKSVMPGVCDRETGRS